MPPKSPPQSPPQTPVDTGPVFAFNRFNFSGLTIELRVLILEFATGNDAEILVVRPTSHKTQSLLEYRDGHERAITGHSRLEVSPPSPARNRLLQINREMRNYLLGENPRFLTFENNINGIARFDWKWDILWLQDLPVLADFVTERPSVPFDNSPRAPAVPTDVIEIISNSPIMAKPAPTMTRRGLAAATQRHRLVRRLAVPGQRLSVASIQRISTFLGLQTLFLSRPGDERGKNELEVKLAVQERIHTAIEANGRLATSNMAWTLPDVVFLEAVFEKAWVQDLEPYIDLRPSPGRGFRGVELPPDGPLTFSIPEPSTIPRGQDQTSPQNTSQAGPSMVPDDGAQKDTSPPVSPAGKRTYTIGG